MHEVAPAVVDLRGHVVGLLADEIARHDSPEVEAALRHFSGVLLHGLISQGHTLAAAGDGAAWIEAVRTVLPGPGRRNGDAADEDGR